MKTQDPLCRVMLLFFSLSILLLTSTASSAAQKPGCDATVKAKLHFKELRTQFIEDSSSVDKSEFRRAASHYIRLAEQCYESTLGAPASGQRIDEGGMWMGPNGATTTAPPVSEDFVLFGTKWGAGSPFTGGADAMGPRLPGGTVTYSFMADGVDLTMETAGLFNVAITSMGSFAPCFLDEIELAFGAWSAVADILFVPVTDGGGPYNVEPTADIRIGAHVFDGPSATLAHAFFPPPNGVTAAGDTHFDSAEPWTCAPGAGSIGFGIVALHELGHAIGLDHEPTDIAVMNPFYNAALTFGPLADDLIGAGEIYGEAGAAGTSFFGPVGIGTDSPDDSDGLAEQFIEVKEGDGDVRVILDHGTASPSFAELLFQSGNTNLWSFGSVVNSGGAGDRFYIFNYGRSEEDVRIEGATGNLILSGTCSDSNGGGGGADGCDGVFDPTYELPSIEEHAAEMWEQQHLPAVGATPDDEKINFSVQKRHFGMLNELEKAHIYIERLNERLKQKEAAIELLNTSAQDKATRLAQVQSENAVLAKRLDRLEALLLAEDH